MKKIINFLDSYRKNEEGSVVIIVALLITVIITAIALVCDLGIAYVKTSEVQNAADAATLAAGMLLPVGINDEDGISEIKNTAADYAQKNGIDTVTQQDITLDNIVNGKYRSINVNIPSRVELNFAKVIGMNYLTVTRSAKTSIKPVTSIYGAAPLGIDYLQLRSAIANNETNNISLKYGAGDGTQGSYGAIDLDGVQGGGASDFSAWLQYGYNGEIKIGEGLLPVEKGNMSGPTASSVTQRYNACTHFQDQGGCTIEHYDPDCPRILKVLVIEKVSSKYVKVRGFAAFILEGEAQSNGEVLGSYIKYIESGNASDGSQEAADDYWMYSLALTN